VLDESRSGRPRETTSDDDLSLLFVSTVDHYFTPREIAFELELDVSARTIDRRLKEFGLPGRVARKKRVFTEEDMKKRLSFAEGYQHWTEQDWERVLFADESIIQGEGGCKSGRVWVRRPVGEFEANKAEYLNHKLPHPKQLNVWGCVAAAGVGYCHIYNESLDAKDLIRILDDNLLASADLVFTESPRQMWYLLHDNAPTHRANLTKAWLHNHGITRVEFPPYSPDLNIIENVWQYIEVRVEKRRPRTIEELQDIIAEEWEKIPKEFVRKLAHSMVHRLKAVIAVNGDHIHY
jgi:transposase